MAAALLLVDAYPGVERLSGEVTLHCCRSLLRTSITLLERSRSLHSLTPDSTLVTSRCCGSLVDYMTCGLSMYSVFTCMPCPQVLFSIATLQVCLLLFHVGAGCHDGSSYIVIHCLLSGLSDRPVSASRTFVCSGGHVLAWVEFFHHSLLKTRCPIGARIFGDYDQGSHVASKDTSATYSHPCSGRAAPSISSA